MIGKGVDSLYVAFYAAIHQKVSDALAHGKLMASDPEGHADEEEVRLDLGGLGFAMKPHGARGYPYLLENELFHVAIAPRAKDKSPSVYVQILSSTLWEMGAIAAWRYVRAWVLRLHDGTDADLRAIVSRIDLAVDVKGVDLSFGDRGAFVTRARSTGAYWCGDMRIVERPDGTVARDDEGVFAKVTKEELEDAYTSAHWVGRTFTGFRFGKSKGVFRAYDKVAEIKKSGKTWFHAIWAVSGWQVGESVFRFEAQLRRELIMHPALAKFFGGLGSPWVKLLLVAGKITRQNIRGALKLRDAVRQQRGVQPRP